MFNKVYSSLQPHLQEAVILAQEKGASSWLTAIPIQEHGFALHKSAFQGAVALRYGWDPDRLPFYCALSCNKGGFPSLQHNEIRDLTASLVSEVCSNVAVEPHLQPLSGKELNFDGASATTDDGARLNIAAASV